MQPINITRRELEVLRLVADERTNKEISTDLGISVGSVESHRHNLFIKLSARNMAGLIRRAYDHGLLQVAHPYIKVK